MNIDGYIVNKTILLPKLHHIYIIPLSLLALLLVFSAGVHGVLLNLIPATFR